MLVRIFILICCSPFSIKLIGQNQEERITGQLLTIPSFHSKFVDSRDIYVWLPRQYDQTHRYNVIYMQDGQMLFDSTRTWNGQEWHVDETLQRLLDEGEIKNTIVVGIPNNRELRNSEYFPQVILQDFSGPENLKKEVLHRWMNDTLLADRYLQFIVEELKPYIDSTYPTFRNKKHTFMMGSSMGGVISLYAMCRYPKTFGGIACLSTHWPLLNPVFDKSESRFELIFMKFHDYLLDHMPSPQGHRIYFDHGTTTLDALYGEYQKEIDDIMREKKYSSRNWVTKVFEGADHSEASWSKRLEVPLKFLLDK